MTFRLFALLSLVGKLGQPSGESLNWFVFFFVCLCLDPFILKIIAFSLQEAFLKMMREERESMQEALMKDLHKSSAEAFFTELNLVISRR